MAQSDLDLNETALKEDLKFYFMNPCEKYRARRQIPWKLALQILKILMVTTQVILLLSFALGKRSSDVQEKQVCGSGPLASLNICY